MRHCGLSHAATELRAAGARALATAYFELAHRLLAGDAGRRFLAAAAPPGVPPVHGYATSDDLDHLLRALAPRSGTAAVPTLLDLGCGTGAVAIEVHRRTGWRVIGLDASAAAIAQGRRRAREAGVQAGVTFRVADMASPPEGADGAYALDALMFVADPVDALARVARMLAPGGRIVATLLARPDGDRLRRRLTSAGLEVVVLEDVTAGLRRQSRRRARAARAGLASAGTVRGRLGLWLVRGEERVVQALLERGWLARWRLVVGGARPGVGQRTAGATSGP